MKRFYGVGTFDQHEALARAAGQDLMERVLFQQCFLCRTENAPCTPSACNTLIDAMEAEGVPIPWGALNSTVEMTQEQYRRHQFPTEEEKAEDRRKFGAALTKRLKLKTIAPSTPNDREGS